MRKFLRYAFLVLLVSIFPLLWAGNRVWWFHVQHSGDRFFNFSVTNGSMYFTVLGLSSPSSEWHIEFARTQPNDGGDLLGNHSFAGFGIKSYATDPSSAEPFLRSAKMGFIRIPFWFLSCLGFLLGYWLWRRERRRRTAGFPVEIQPK